MNELERAIKELLVTLRDHDEPTKGWFKERATYILALLDGTVEVDTADSAEANRFAELEVAAKTAIGNQNAEAKVIAEIEGVDSLDDADPEQILEAVEKVKASA